MLQVLTTFSSSQVKGKLTEVIRVLPKLKTIATNLKNNELLNFINSRNKVFVHSSFQKRFTECKSISAEMKKVEFCKNYLLAHLN